MKEFELSFKNKRVSMWFILVLPVIILSGVLFFLLPTEYQWVPSFLPVTAIIIFFCWVKSDKKKSIR